MILSIIIPMYNCEQYIAQCLDSILTSDLPKDDYEVIIVNDGSKDRGPEIAQDYCKKYDNLIYLTQENQGQSVARNEGTKAANGIYLWFVDADDRLESVLMPVVLQLNNGLDILGVQLRMVDETGDSKRMECTQPSVEHGRVMRGRDAMVQGYNPSSVCALIVRREFVTLHKLFFHPGITHQDVELSYQWMTYGKTVLFTDLSPYIYILHSGSTSQSISPEKKIKYLTDDLVVMKTFERLAGDVAAADHQLAAVIRQRVKSIELGMVISLHSNRKQWRPLGISQAVLSRMIAEQRYPLRGNYGSRKKNLLKHVLNIKWMVV